MALLYHAEIRPSKIELIEGWAPDQPWFQAAAEAGFSTIAAYRFDDPEGEVGIETLIVRIGDGTLLQVPMTYRGAPLEGAEAWLIGTMQHEVLGDRWVYDATGDPAYLAALATAVFTGGTQAEQFFEVDGKREPRELNALVRGGGTDAGAEVPASKLVPVATRHESGTTIATAGDIRASIARVLESPGPNGVRATFDAAENVATARLTGTWTDQPVPATLAVVVPR